MRRPEDTPRPVAGWSNPRVTRSTGVGPQITRLTLHVPTTLDLWHPAVYFFLFSSLLCNSSPRYVKHVIKTRRETDSFTPNPLQVNAPAACTNLFQKELHSFSSTNLIVQIEHVMCRRFVPLASREKLIKAWHKERSWKKWSCPPGSILMSHVGCSTNRQFCIESSSSNLYLGRLSASEKLQLLCVSLGREGFRNEVYYNYFVQTSKVNTLECISMYQS